MRIGKESRVPRVVIRFVELFFEFEALLLPQTGWADDEDLAFAFRSLATIFPAFSQLRSVFGETPRYSAASEIRR
jgi:hypothetical protein